MYRAYNKMFIVFINDEPKKLSISLFVSFFFTHSAANGLASASCEALAEFRFWHLDQHLLKPGDFEDISFSRILRFIQSAGLLTC